MISNHKPLLLIKIFLIVIVPLFTLGFNVFEKTKLYTYVFHIAGVESAINYKLTTQYGDAERLSISLQNNQSEFEDIWRLIKSNTEYPLPDGVPIFISRFALNNAAFVNIPNNGGSKKVILIPDSVPVATMYCTQNAKDISGCDGRVIGSVGDIKKWLENKKSTLRIMVDFFITLTSITLGLLSIFADKKLKRDV